MKTPISNEQITSTLKKILPATVINTQKIIDFKNLIEKHSLELHEDEFNNHFINIWLDDTARNFFINN